MKKILKIVLIAVILMPIFNIHIYAANLGLELSPAEERIQSKSNSTINKSFILKDNDINEIQVTFKVGELKNSKVIFDNLSNDSSVNWIKINTDSLVIKSGETKKIDYTIKIPTYAQSGLYTPIISIHLKANTLQNISGSFIEEDIAYRLTIQVINDSKDLNEVKILDFNSNKKIVLLDNTIQFNISLGNINPQSYSKPIIYFHLIDPQGNIINQSIINESLEAIIQGDIFKRSLNVDLGQVKAENLGEYKAEVLVVDTITNTSTLTKLSFYFIPLKYLLLIILIVALLIIAIVILIRKRKAKIGTSLK